MTDHATVAKRRTEVQKLHAEGLARTEAAARLGVSMHVIHHDAKARGIRYWNAHGAKISSGHMRRKGVRQ